MSRIYAERDRRAREVLSSTAAGSVRFFDPDVGEHICRHLDLEGIGDLMDIGTGMGRVLKLLAPFARSAVGIDISSDMLAVARSNLNAAGLGRVMVRHGDMYRLPYPAAAFDTVTVDSVLSHARRPADALREAARILRPGGTLLVIETPGERGDAAQVDQAALRAWAADTPLAFGRGRLVGGGAARVELYRATNEAHDAAVA